MRSLPLGAALLALLGCSPSAPARAALEGDLPALKAAVAGAQRGKELGRARVKELASAVVRRELMAARGAEGSARIVDLAGCVAQAESSLSERAAGTDEVAAGAQLLLLEQGLLGAGDVRADARDPRPEFRALAARAATSSDKRPLRLQLILDGDERVRRAALGAAAVARDPADVSALLEAARQDPDPQARGRAVLALGAVGGNAAVLGLADLWPLADEALRGRIVEAWAMPASFATGGAAELVRAAELSSGIPAISAALVLEERKAGPPGLAEELLLRAIADGAPEDRRFALRAAPLADPRVLAAVQATSRSAPPSVRLTALARLLTADKPEPQALAPLRELASSPVHSLAVPARAALAAGKDSSVKPLLEQGLKASRSSERRLAAFGLIWLGDFDVAANALADDSPSVRTRVACRVLAAP